MEAMNTLSSDIHSAAASLGVLAGKVDPETWEYLRIVRSHLQASAEQVENLETRANIARQPIIICMSSGYRPAPWYPQPKHREERRHD